MTIELDSNEEKNDESIHSISEAINILETGINIKVKGTIVSLSSPYKVISKSQSICENIKCNYTNSQDYDPPRWLPIKHLDNMANGNDEIVSCKKCSSTVFVVKHTFLNARSIQLEDNIYTCKVKRYLLISFIFNNPV